MRSCQRGISPNVSGSPALRRELGFRGVNMTADPQDSGSPDLGDPAWDAFWEVCAGLDLPVHFHIGASQTALSYFGTTFWPSQDDYVKRRSVARRCSRTTRDCSSTAPYSGMFDRHPASRWSPSRAGSWVPFMLEAMDYELEENAPEWFHKLRSSLRSISGTTGTPPFWFETGRGDLQTPHRRRRPRTTSCSKQISPPHQPASEPLEMVKEKNRHAAAGDPTQGDGRERRQALQVVGVGSARRCHGRGGRSRRRVVHGRRRLDPDSDDSTTPQPRRSRPA